MRWRDSSGVPAPAVFPYPMDTRTPSSQQRQMLVLKCGQFVTFGAMWRRSLLAIWSIELYAYVAPEQVSVSCIPWDPRHVPTSRRRRAGACLPLANLSLPTC